METQHGWQEAARFSQLAAVAFDGGQRAWQALAERSKRIETIVSSYLGTVEAFLALDTVSPELPEDELRFMAGQLAFICKMHRQIREQHESLLPAVHRKRWESAEDALEDLHAGTCALIAEKDPSPPVPWDDVKRDLGL